MKAIQSIDDDIDNLMFLELINFWAGSRSKTGFASDFDFCTTYLHGDS